MLEPDLLSVSDGTTRRATRTSGVLLLLAGRPACHATDAKPCLAAGPQYPLFRPPAQWSKLIGKRCQSGGLGWECQSRDEDTGQCLTEIRKSLKMIHAIHQVPNVSSGTGRTAARLIPSPDWFTGVDSLDLCDGGHWKPRVTLELRPYDAGTDSGFTFSSPNFPTLPAGEHHTRVGAPITPAQLFYYPRLAETTTLATLTIVRRTKRPAGRLHPSHNATGISNSFYSNLPETPLDCEVSRWSSWGLCSAPCAQAGLRQRTRFVLLRPANDGEPCPDLEEESPCVWEGCSVDGDRR
uniref:Spondin domain-containing protein n=1 Tax=Erpetoichthys calabaricus TaxID=27687 RepID=A0A8C4XD27_ERPCA